MKAFKFTFILALLVSFVFISCDNEPLTGTFSDESGLPGSGSGTGGTGTGGTGGTNVSTNSFFAKVDGVEFVEDLLLGSVSNFNGEQVIRITASKNITYESIGLSFPHDIVPGSYSLSTFSGGDVLTAQYNLSQTVLGYGGGGGTAIITSHDVANRRVVGSFSFIGDQVIDTPGAPLTVAITQGSFDITY